jgi:hypothetical protein
MIVNVPVEFLDKVCLYKFESGDPQHAVWVFGSDGYLLLWEDGQAHHTYHNPFNIFDNLTIDNSNP